MTKTERALLVDCTECGAKAGAPCVLTSLKNIPVEVQSTARQARIEATGTPTARPHNARFNAAPPEKRTKPLRYVYTMHKIDLEMCDIYSLHGMMWRLVTKAAIRQFDPRPCRSCLPDFDEFETQEVIVIRTVK